VLGRLADALDRLGELASEIGAVHTIVEWVDLIRRTSGALFDTDRDGPGSSMRCTGCSRRSVYAGHRQDGPSMVLLEYRGRQALFDEHLDPWSGDRTSRGGITSRR